MRNLFTRLWFSSLNQQYFPVPNTRFRQRRQRNRRHGSPTAATQMPLRQTETLEDRTLLTSVFSVDDVTIAEGDSGLTEIVFTVTRTGAIPGLMNSAASVHFTTQDGTATTLDGDYVARADSLSFAADPSAVEQSQTITVQVLGDVLTEGNETFELRLFNNSDGTSIQNSVGTATITNDDLNAIHVKDVAAAENEAFAFEISLDEVSGADITFWVSTETDTADTADYTFLKNKQVMIPAGELSTLVNVHVFDDENWESDETFSMVVSAPRIDGELVNDTVSVAEATGQGTILNDDGLSESVFTITSEKMIEGDEGSQTLKFKIVRTGWAVGDLNFDTSVEFTTINGTAVAGEDFTAKSQVVEFAASTYLTSQTAVVYVTVQGDPFRELSETVIGRISNPTGGSVLKGNVASLDATGIIANDDSDFVFQESYSADPAHANHSYDRVGTAVAIDGDVMVVGASNNNFGGYNTGAAYIYVRNQQGTPLDQTDDTWDYQTFLKSPSPQEQAYFGSSIAIYGDTIVVGAKRDPSGTAYVFTRVGEDWKSEPPHVEQIHSVGGAAYSGFGTSVAIYENTIVVGARTTDFNINPINAVYIYEKTGIDWSAPSISQLVHTVTDYDDSYGKAVAIHGDTIVVGAGYDNTKGTKGGAAYVYSKVGDSWITQAPLLTKLTASNGVSGDLFGLSVATNGTDILIGASSRSSNGDYSGSAYLYTRMGSDWSAIAPNEIEFYGDAASDHFGSMVSISENQMVVGAISAREIGRYFGAVYVYTKSGSEWDVDTIVSSKLTYSRWASIGYANSIAVSNNTILVGALNDSLDGDRSGGVYVYEFSDDNSWLLTTEINPTEPLTAHQVRDDFGRAIAVSNDYLVIGAPGTDSNLAPTGIVYVYAKNDAGTPDYFNDDRWEYETSLRDPVPGANLEFGTGVAIDGNTIIVTAETSSAAYGAEVFIYTRNGADWVTIPPTVTRLLANASRNILNGISVAIQNDTIVVGHKGNSFVDYSGVVFVFERNGADWSTIAPTESIISASDGIENDNFGTAVDIDGDQIIVGAPDDDGRGAAYLFQKGTSGWNSATEYKLIGSDIQFNDDFGRLVAIDGNTVAISSWGTDYVGAVYIFDGTQGWLDPTETRIDPISDTSKYDFGRSIDLDGNLLVVTGSAPPNYLSNGCAYIFDGSAGWGNFEETIITYSTDSELYHRGFGQSAAAIHQNNLLVAALYKGYTDNSLVYSYNRSTIAEMHLQIVNSITDVQPDGIADSLPPNQNTVSEWSTYWAEIWINASNLKDQGILSAGLDLSYNSEYTSATEIEYGDGFTQNRAGTINDQSGIIEGLYAETTASDLGTDSYALLARIKFESLADDQVELDFSGKSIGPYDLGFNISSQQVKLVDNTSALVKTGSMNGASIYANPFDLNDDDVVNYRDLILFASVYQHIPSQSNSKYPWFADYNQDDFVNYRDLIQFAVNYGRRKSGPNPIHYPANYPDAWNQLLMVAAPQPPEPAAAPVTQSAAETVLESTVDEISPQLTTEQQATLSEVDIQVVDLSAGTLGRAAAGTIYIDVNAAGYGWFVDATPNENSEFSATSDLTLIALPDSEAAGLVDLRTVILHELGHLLGFDHTEDGLMQETLSPGVRYLSDWESATDEFFSALTDETAPDLF
jgi:hypothetical protein